MIPSEQKLLKLLSNNDVTFFIPPYLAVKKSYGVVVSKHSINFSFIFLISFVSTFTFSFLLYISFGGLVFSNE